MKGHLLTAGDITGTELGEAPRVPQPGAGKGSAAPGKFGICPAGKGRS